MRLLSRLALLSLPFLVAAQDAEGVNKKSYGYQSDVARLRKIVINSLYSHRDVFLRELISNSNDALEKLRITTLTAATIPEESLNITIRAYPSAEGAPGRLVITDYGIGMSPEDLATNLGTLAKSGTTDFLASAEKDATAAGNLIGQFGVGFYSAFLVSDQIYVASVPYPTKENPNPVQHVFSSTADDSNFEIYADPRGNSLGRGTEITLLVKDDALEYLQTEKLRELVAKHSAFATTYPIYLYTIKTEEVVDTSAAEAEALTQPTSPADAVDTTPADAKDEETLAEPTSPADAEPETTAPAEEKDEDEAVVDDVVDDEPAAPKEEVTAPPVPMKNVTTEEWVHLNDQPPLWARDPKSVTKDEYDLFYRSTFKDSNNPLSLHHFKGDAGSVSFRALLFIPPNLEKEFWQSAKAMAGGIKIMVKRVFITSDLGDANLPKWASWLRAIVDADDLPLNVSRETLQSTRFLKQIRQTIINRALALFAKVAEEDEALYKKMIGMYGAALKMGAVDSQKERAKLVGLTRWDTNLRNFTSLDQYVANKKVGQTQLFFIAGAGSTPELLAKSVFVEKLHARGYEVLLAHEPMDEILLANLREWKGLKLQDVAKKGLVFGDEELTAEEEKAELEVQETKFKPLIDFLKEEAAYAVKEVTISNRLVTSACAIVADQWGYSANMEKLMNAQTNPNQKRDGQEFMHDWARKQKSLEINPRSPLIQGLLKKVNQLTDIEEGESRDPELETEVKEVVSILIDGALVRSGFDVADSNEFFTRIDRVLRRSLGVSEEAETDTTVAPAPPIDEDLSAVQDPVEILKNLNAELESDEKITDEPPQFEQQITFDDLPGEPEPVVKVVNPDVDEEIKLHDEL